MYNIYYSQESREASIKMALDSVLMPENFSLNVEENDLGEGTGSTKTSDEVSCVIFIIKRA